MQHLPPRDRSIGAAVGICAATHSARPVEWQTLKRSPSTLLNRGGYTLHEYLDPWALRAGKKADVIKRANRPTTPNFRRRLCKLVICRGLKESDLYYRCATLSTAHRR